MNRTNLNMAQIIDGKALAQGILDDLQKEIAEFSFQPVFCDVLVGEDPVSRSYVNMKAKAAEEIGLKFQPLELPSNTTTESVIDEIKNIQNNPHLAGLIVQLPLPDHLDKHAILDAIEPRLDVDCLGSKNSNAFYEGQSLFIPPTAAAVMAVISSLRLELSKLKIVVVGQGDLVGRPVTYLLKQIGLNPATADESIVDLKQLTSKADVVISATGQPRLITAEMIKEQAVVIDCGTAESRGGIVGDADLESIEAKASVVSPVPGGVGPVTVARLLYNVVQSAKDLKNV